MASKFSTKLYRLVFIILTSILFFLSVLFFFISLNKYILKQEIIKLNNFLEPATRTVQIRLNQTITYSQVISTHLTNFYLPNSPLFLSDEHLQTLSSEIFKNNYYIQGIGYIVIADIELSITSDNYINNNFYGAIWFKNFNNQIIVKPFNLEEIKNPNLLLIAKHKKQTFLAKPFLYKQQGVNSLIQPIVTPMYIGDKFIGINVLLLSMDFVDKIYIDLKNYNPNYKLILFNREGTVLYYPMKLYLGSSLKNIILDDFVKFIKAISQKQFINDKLDKYFVVNQYINAIEREDYWGISLFSPYKKLLFKKYIIFFLMILVSILISAAAIGLVILFSSPYTNIFSSLYKNIFNIYRGNLEQHVDILTSFYETEKLTHILERLRLRLLTISELHNKLAKRSYTEELPPTSPTDMLANSINYAFKEITKQWKDRLEIEKTKKQTDWINNGLSKIYKATRLEKSSFNLLAKNVIDVFIEHTEAIIAGFFVYYEKEKALRSVLTFAYDKEKTFEREIKPGQGYIGAVVLEKKMKYISKLPDDYKILILGLGETKPKSALILPLILNEQVQGVIELLFLQELENYKMEFFELTSIVIAQAIKSIKTNLEAEQLLKQTQKQAQELEKTRIQLQEHIKELEDREKELRDSQTQMKGILEAVNHTLLTVKYKIDGTFVEANELFYKKLEYSYKELEGVNILEIVPEDTRKEIRDIIRQVAKGKHISKIVKRKTKQGETLWLYASYTPYYDENGKITNLLFFAFDITDTYNQIQELKAKIEVLTKEIEIFEKALKKV